MGPKFSLCFDYSFWQTESQRCVPQDLDHVHTQKYPYPSLCNRTYYNCTDGFFHDPCPNTDDTESCSKKEDHFFCEESRTCIPKGKSSVLW